VKRRRNIFGSTTALPPLRANRYIAIALYPKWPTITLWRML
jgi:hypothetical protein